MFTYMYVVCFSLFSPYFPSSLREPDSWLKKHTMYFAARICTDHQGMLWIPALSQSLAFRFIDQRCQTHMAMDPLRQPPSWSQLATALTHSYRAILLRDGLEDWTHTERIMAFAPNEWWLTNSCPRSWAHLGCLSRFKLTTFQACFERRILFK